MSLSHQYFIIYSSELKVYVCVCVSVHSYAGAFRSNCTRDNTARIVSRHNKRNISIHSDFSSTRALISPKPLARASSPRAAITATFLFLFFVRVQITKRTQSLAYCLQEKITKSRGHTVSLLMRTSIFLYFEKK